MKEQFASITPTQSAPWFKHPFVQTLVGSFILSTLIIFALLFIPAIGRFFALNSTENYQAILQYNQLYSPEQYPEKLIWVAKKNPQAPKLLLMAGASLQDRNQDTTTSNELLEKAFRLYAKKYTKMPHLLDEYHRQDLAETSFRWGKDLFEENQQNNAFNLFSYALEIDPTYQDKLEAFIENHSLTNSVDLAAMWWRGNQPDKAQNCLDQLGQQPAQRNWNFLSGCIALQHDNPREAQFAFERELALFPDNLSALIAKAPENTSTNQIKTLLQQSGFTPIYQNIPNKRESGLVIDKDTASLYGPLTVSFSSNTVPSNLTDPLYLLAVTGKDFNISPLVELRLSDGSFQLLHLTKLSWWGYELPQISPELLNQVELTSLNGGGSGSFDYPVQSDLPEYRVKNRHLTTNGLLWVHHDKK